jgi:hypothetical protein
LKNDTEVSELGKSGACFATFEERKTRYNCGMDTKQTNRDVGECRGESVGGTTARNVKSITCDRKCEFGN